MAPIFAPRLHMYVPIVLFTEGPIAVLATEWLHSLVHVQLVLLQVRFLCETHRALATNEWLFLGVAAHVIKELTRTLYKLVAGIVQFALEYSNERVLADLGFAIVLIRAITGIDIRTVQFVDQEVCGVRQRFLIARIPHIKLVTFGNCYELQRFYSWELADYTLGHLI